MDVLLALLTHERDREAVRAALPARARPRFVERAAELRGPWPEGRPAAVLAELADADGRSTAHALAAFRRRAPTVPVCAYIPSTAAAMRAVLKLGIRGVVTDVLIVPDDTLHVQLRHLLRSAHRRGERASLRRVWRGWTAPEVRDVVATCIAASTHAATVEEVSAQLGRSPRTIGRLLAQAGLPPVHRMLGWCRLLRAAYRLDRPGATAKGVAAELGYPSPRALARHLHRHAGLTLGELRAGGGFRAFAARLEAELAGARIEATGQERAGAGHRR